MDLLRGRALTSRKRRSLSGQSASTVGMVCTLRRRFGSLVSAPDREDGAYLLCNRLVEGPIWVLAFTHVIPAGVDRTR